MQHQTYVAAMPNSPIHEPESEHMKDLFDNDFIPRSPVAFIEDDFLSDSLPGIPNAAAWKFYNVSQWIDDTGCVCPKDINSVLQPRRRLKYPSMDQFLDDFEHQSDCDSCDPYSSGTPKLTFTSFTPSTTPRTILPIPRQPPSSFCTSRSPRKTSHGTGDIDYQPTAQKRKAKRSFERAAIKRWAVETKAILSTPKGVSWNSTQKILAQKTQSGSRAKPGTGGLFYCPVEECSHKCRALGDMERHLQSSKHQEPSIPCPRGCSKMFTRTDAAMRHSKGKGCKAKRYF